MTLQTVAHNGDKLKGFRVETDVLQILEQQGARTLNQLESDLVHIGSAQLLFAIDRLSRSGKIGMGPHHNREYLVWVIPESQYQPTPF
ncbi:MAG: hypothetical protein ACT4PN_16710 [Nitrospiraceae bacterium]